MPSFALSQLDAFRPLKYGAMCVIMLSHGTALRVFNII